ncbi:hypothetical protein DY218_24840 [Streptomyces triticagri]|uniref:Uncharacterized protein n=1 Tax=Streptomyces triticagri TaxID=2293568 RepID=A0A372M098_9ACTN|nr:hypothetical protein DY218_24840 [Streptomyces triticagri]
MTCFGIYRTNTYTAQQVTDFLADTTRIKVQPNAIPGDDGTETLDPRLPAYGQPPICSVRSRLPIARTTATA